MAKSIRSKSLRKSRAILHARVFKPVEEARTARLSAKLYSIPVTNIVPLPTCPASSTCEGGMMMVDTVKTKKSSITNQITQKIQGSKKSRRAQKQGFKEFNLFGLSEKEVRF